MSYRNQGESKRFSISKTKIFLIFLTFAAFLLGQFAYLYLGKTIPENLEAAAKYQGARLKINDFQTSFPLKFSAQSFVATLPPNNNIPLNLNVECLKTNGRFKLLSLLGLNKNINFKSNCYGGELKGSVKGKIYNNQFSLNYQAKDLKLENYPLLKLFNVKGKVSSKGDVTSKESSEEIKEYQGNIELKEGSFPGGYGFGSPLPLPEISDVQVSCKIFFENTGSNRKFSGDIELTNCEGDSSLLSVTGEAKGRVGNFNQLIQGSINFELNLTDQGVKDIGGYLTLASGEYNENPAKNWQIFVEKKANGQIINKIKPSS